MARIATWCAGLPNGGVRLWLADAPWCVCRELRTVESPLAAGATLVASTERTTPLLESAGHFLQLRARIRNDRPAFKPYERTLGLSGVLVDLWNHHVDIPSIRGEMRPENSPTKVRADDHVCAVNRVTEEDEHNMMKAFEKNMFLDVELQRWEPTWSQLESRSIGGDLLIEMMTVEEAKLRAITLENCAGFHFQGQLSGARVEIHFKSK